jgi:fatty acid desaturase
MPLMKARLDFLHMQVLTARNVKSSPFTDIWYGGLNYQIEHHLFPSMPRNNYGKASKIIKTFCRQQSIEHCEAGVFQTYKDILGHFHRIGAVLRNPDATRATTAG